MPLLRLVLTLVLATAWAGSAWALDQDLGELQRAAEVYARGQTGNLPGQVDVAAAPLDPRTRLGRCESLQPFLPPGAKLWGTANVGLRCLKPENWTVYIPVTVKVTGDVVVTALPVRRGQVLGPEDVRLERADLTQLPTDVLTDPQRAVGRSANVAFPAGLHLAGGHAADPLRGDRGTARAHPVPGRGLHRELRGQSAEQRRSWANRSRCAPHPGS